MNAIAAIVAKQKIAARLSLDGADGHSIDAHEWRRSVGDLHRVMDLAHKLYLMLEHNNEALLRVASEIVLCRQSRKCLWWPETWYGDDVQREKFEEIVNSKLDHVVVTQTGKTMAPSSGPPASDTKFENLQSNVAELEKLLEASRKQQNLAEQKMREALEEAEDAQNTISGLEKSIGARDRQAKMSAAEAEAELVKKLADLEKLAAERQEKINQLTLEKGTADKKRAELDAKLDEAQQEAAAKQGELAALRDQISELQESLRKLQGGVAPPPRQETVALPPKKPPMKDKSVQAAIEVTLPSDDTSSEELLAMARQLEEKESQCDELLLQVEQQRATAEEREGDLERAQDEIRELRHQLASAEAQLRDSLGEPVPVAAPPKPEVRHIGVSATRPDSEAQELRQQLETLQGHLDKANNKISKLSNDLAAMTAERDRLEKQTVNMSKMLKQLQDQVTQLKEIARKRGCGDLIDEILGESGIKETVLSKEFSIYSRLYNDALRRMEKMRSIEQHHHYAKRADEGEGHQVGHVASNGVAGGAPPGVMKRRSSFDYGTYRPPDDHAPNADKLLLQSEDHVCSSFAHDAFRERYLGASPWEGEGHRLRARRTSVPSIPSTSHQAHQDAMLSPSAGAVGSRSTLSRSGGSAGELRRASVHAPATNRFLVTDDDPPANGNSFAVQSRRSVAVAAGPTSPISPSAGGLSARGMMKTKSLPSKTFVHHEQHHSHLGAVDEYAHRTSPQNAAPQSPSSLESPSHSLGHLKRGSLGGPMSMSLGRPHSPGNVGLRPPSSKGNVALVISGRTSISSVPDRHPGTPSTLARSLELHGHSTAIASGRPRSSVSALHVAVPVAADISPPSGAGTAALLVSAGRGASHGSSSSSPVNPSSQPSPAARGAIKYAESGPVSEGSSPAHSSWGEDPVEDETPWGEPVKLISVKNVSMPAR